MCGSAAGSTPTPGAQAAPPHPEGPGAGVRPRPGGPPPPRPQLDGAARRRELEGIAQQVPEHLDEPGRIAPDEVRLVGEILDQAPRRQLALVAGLQGLLDDLAEGGRLVRLLQIADAGAGEGEQVVDKPRLQLDGAAAPGEGGPT